MRIGIAGAGLMGRLIAWRLKGAGCDVSLFDQDVSGQKSAAYAAAGMLSPYAECESKERDVFDLGMRGLAAWKKLLPMFTDASWFQQRGSFVVAHEADKQYFDNFQKRILEKIAEPKLEQRFAPDLNAKYSLFFPEEAVIDSRELLQQINVPVSSETILSVQPNTIVAQKKEYTFDLVFDCRGVYGGEHFSDLRSVRGELIFLHAPEVYLDCPVRLIHPRYRLYIVPRANNVFLIGASEIEANDHSAISVRTCLELLSAAYSVHSGFAEARIIETITATRPALNNNLPRIVKQDGLIAVNGLYRHGFLFAPALLEEICHDINIH